MKILLRLGLAFLAALLLDLASKLWAEYTLTPYTPVPIIGDFLRLTLGYNTGVAFGLFSNGGLWPLVITALSIVFLFFWFTKSLSTRHFPAWTAWPIGLLLGGAVGNFLNRIYSGQVTDFIDAGIGPLRWPTFNLADSFILTGVSLLVLSTFFLQEEEDAAPPYIDNASISGESDIFPT